MRLELPVAGAAVAAVVAYGVLAGADFGGGVWDMFARGPRKRAQREAIAHAMGPVWEANHVWLIFLLVVLFTGFPAAFYALSVGLYVPFHLVLVGIILRGAAFAFRGYGPLTEQARGRWGVVFGGASVVTPVLLGMCLGAVSAGRLRVRDGVVSAGAAAWLGPLPIAMGALALALCAYLAAVFLTLETEGELRLDFRRRALIAGTFVVGASALALPFLYLRARNLWDGLVSLRAAPVLAAGLVAALTSGWALRAHRFRLARTAAVAQVTCLLTGWALAQYPYMVYPDVTLSQAAAPAPTLRLLLIIVPAGAVLLVPSLWLLFRVFKTSPRSAAEDARHGR